jgi:hypothetical protein
MNHRPHQFTESQTVTTRDFGHLDAQRVHSVEPPGDRRRPVEASTPKEVRRDQDAADVESPNDVHHRVEVIGVRVRHHDRVQLPNAEGSQRRHDDPASAVLDGR